MLKINPKFKDLIPPLSPEEFCLLEQSIRTQGCRDAIITWRGAIIDGHNRYAICTKHNIGYKVKETRFPSHKAAMLWIVENQLGRRNLSDAARIELAMRKAANRKDIADYARLSETTVQKYIKIKKVADPALLQRLWKGEEKISTAYHIVSRKVFKVNDTPDRAKCIEYNLNKIEEVYRRALECANIGQGDVVGLEKALQPHVMFFVTRQRKRFS